jgi:outer membrane protein assembly factor BamB
VFTSPTVVGDRLFVGSCSGVFYAFDKRTGDVLWAHDTAKDGATANFHGDPLVAGDLIVTGSDSTQDGFVYAFEQATGKVRWKVPVEGGASTDVLRHGNHALTVTAGGELLCLDLETGERKWSIPPEIPHPEFQRSSAVLASGMVFFAGPDSRLYAVDAGSGRLLWTRDIGGVPSTSLATLGDHLYVGTRDDRFLRLDLYSGQLGGMIATDGTPFGTPVPWKNTLFLLTSPDRLLQLDAGLTTILGAGVAPTEWTSFRPHPFQGGVLAGDDSGELFSFDLEDGTVQWTDVFRGSVRGLGSSEDVLYVGTLSGMLYAYRPGERGASSGLSPARVPGNVSCGQAVPGSGVLLEESGLVLVGEFHGTREGPQAFGALACAAARAGHDLLLGLEMPVAEGDILEAAFTAPSAREAQATLLESPFFTRPYQDGRSSQAMVDLVLVLRSLSREGRKVRLFAFDPAIPENRDRLMAEVITAMRNQNPGATVLALVGNLHARKVMGTRWDPGFHPMARHLEEMGQPLRSVRLLHAPGEAWYCSGMEPDTCGTRRVGGDDQGPEARFLLLPDEVSEAYDAVLYLGKVTASEPAARRLAPKRR